MTVHRPLALLFMLLALGACAAAPTPGSLSHDPFEAHNRGVHATNKDIDRAVLGPTARAYGTTVPRPVRRGVANLNANWQHPRHAIQYVLQGRPGQSVNSVSRFVVNTTLGIGGIFDVAQRFGLTYRETDTDEVFARYGIPEGGYLELPVIGPGTQRDWTGFLVDVALDPLLYVTPIGFSNGLVAVAGLDIVNDRYELDPVLDELLYSSADSYTAQRLAYLQNQRARLAGDEDSGLEDLEDIYADF